MTLPPKTKTVPQGKSLKTKGLLIVHTGDGKGKTTAALGLALRALGCGFKVFMVQFIKGDWKYGELESAKRFEGQFEIHPAGEGFTWDVPDDEKQKKLARSGWEKGKAAVESGERVWELPMWKEYEELVKSDVADVKNADESPDAGATEGGMFLKQFVGETPWVHLDIAGTAWVEKPTTLVRTGATGWGVRLLIEFFKSQA